MKGGLEMEQRIENRREKLKRYSKRTYRILIVVLVLTIILWVSYFLYGVWQRLELPILDTIGSGHFNIALLGVGESLIGIPAVGIGFVHISTLPRYNFAGFVMMSLVWFFMTVAPLFYVVHIFRELGNGCSPFDERISKAARVLAVLLVIIAINTSWILLVAAALMGLFARIFDYGRLLQEENDTTL